MPTRVAPVGAQWQGAEAPVYAGMSDRRRSRGRAQSSAGSRRYAGRPRAGVVGAVGAGGRAALLERRLLARSHPAGGDQEGRVADHRVAGPDGEALHVPVADQRLPRRGLGEAAVHADRLDEARELGRRGDVGAEDPARTERVGGHLEALPGRQHVQHDPVALLARLRQELGQVADVERPRRVLAPEELGDVAAGHLGELLAPLVRRDPSARADGAQQRAGERTGPGARLDHVRAREDVDQRDDLRRVLGVDDRRTARHRDHELREQRPEHEVLAAGRRGDREPLLAADQLVVVEVALVGEEPLAGLEAEVVAAALAVDQPHPLAGAQRAAVHPGHATRHPGGVAQVGHPGNLQPGRRLRLSRGRTGTPGPRPRW